MRTKVRHIDEDDKRQNGGHLEEDVGKPGEGVPGHAASQAGLPEQHPVSPDRENCEDFTK